MTASEDTRERIARAIWGANFPHPVLPWERLIEATRDDCRRIADAVLAVVGSSPTDPGVRGECQVCGTETDEHHPNCEIGQLRAQLRSAILDKAGCCRVRAQQARDAIGEAGELRARLVGSSPVGEEREALADMYRAGWRAADDCPEKDQVLRGQIADVRGRLKARRVAEVAAAPPVGVDEGKERLQARQAAMKATMLYRAKWPDPRVLVDWKDAVADDLAWIAVEADPSPSSAAPGVTEGLVSALLIAAQALELAAKAEPFRLGPSACRKSAMEARDAALAVSPARYPSVFKQRAREIVEGLSPAPTEGRRFSFEQLVAIVDEIVCQFPPDAAAPLLRDRVADAVAKVAAPTEGPDDA